MTQPIKIGKAYNPERITVTYDGITCAGAQKRNNPYLTGVNGDLVLSFFPKVKNPMKLTEIIINGTQVGDIISASPSKYTDGFWVFFVSLRDED